MDKSITAMCSLLQHNGYAYCTEDGFLVIMQTHDKNYVYSKDLDLRVIDPALKKKDVVTNMI